MVYIVIAVLVISASLAVRCPPGEYKNNDLCCPMCNIGTVVKTHCNPSSSSNVCVPCVDGTYMDHPNGLTKCFKCSECDTGAGLLEIKKCTYTSNTECECQPGYYCPGSNSPCDLCMPQKICVYGEYIKLQGTPRTDTVCEKCPAGHFSAENMSTTCTAWTKCSETSLLKTKQGTPTSDSVCVTKRKYLGTLAAFLIVFLVPLLFSFLYFCLCTRDKSENQQKQSDTLGPHSEFGSPIQEKGIESTGRPSEQRGLDDLEIETAAP